MEKSGKATNQLLKATETYLKKPFKRQAKHRPKHKACKPIDVVKQLKKQVAKEEGGNFPPLPYFS